MAHRYYAHTKVAPCELCGAFIPPEDARPIEEIASYLCEGCSEDEEESLRSADADAREFGTDTADDYRE